MFFLVCNTSRADFPFHAVPYYRSVKAELAITSDLNNDSIPDLVLIGDHRYNPGLFVAIGDGHGGLAKPIQVDSMDFRSTVAAHFRSGQSVDLVAIQNQKPLLSLFSNDGSGKFTRAGDYKLKNIALGLAAGDINGDGIDDIAVAVSGEPSGSIEIFLGTPNGMPRLFKTIAAPSPTAVAFGHFDEDQIPDLAVTSYHENTLTIFHGAGSGDFSLLTKVAISTGVLTLARWDLDNDGKDDLYATNIYNQIVIVRSTGNAHFESPRTFQMTGIRGVAIIVSPAMRNTCLAVQDGYDSIDLITRTSSGYSRRKYFFFGTGAMAAADWSSDGQLELAVNIADFNSDVAYMALVPTNGNALHIPPHRNAGFVSGPYDFNQDGSLDLMGTNYVLLGKGNGQFEKKTIPFAVYDYQNFVAPAYINNDSAPDLFIIREYRNSGFRLNDGKGGFGPEHPLAKGITNAVTGDMNHDSHHDVLLVTDGGYRAALGLGHAAFAAPVIAGPWHCDDNPLLVDFDGDGLADMVQNCANTIQVYHGNGDGTFQKKPEWRSVDDGVTALSLHDWNKDGKADLILADYDGVVYYLRGLGGGAFDRPQAFDGPGNPVACLIADFDGDGRDDLAVVGEDGAVALYVGGSDAATPFSPPVFVGAGIPLYGTAVTGDFNNDGRPDIVGSNEYPQSMVVFLNRR